ncbi:hypothetical protein Tco_1054969 [Tanacetum coccineum]|uniref:Pinin n=1 Tax=Tanacetum coccineum TaxID=301880 RepID=A0ABQ5GYA5_9ASTR
MERFKNAIFKQREEIKDRMAEMFRLLKELTASQTSERVEEENNVEGNEVVNKNVMEPDRSDAAVPPKEVDKMNGAGNRIEGEPVRSANELVEAPSS